MEQNPDYLGDRYNSHINSVISITRKEYFLTNITSECRQKLLPKYGLSSLFTDSIFVHLPIN